MQEKINGREKVNLEYFDFSRTVPKALLIPGIIVAGIDAASRTPNPSREKLIDHFSKSMEEMFQNHPSYKESVSFIQRCALYSNIDNCYLDMHLEDPNFNAFISQFERLLAISLKLEFYSELDKVRAVFAKFPIFIVFQSLSSNITVFHKENAPAIFIIDRNGFYEIYYIRETKIGEFKDFNFMENVQSKISSICSHGYKADQCRKRQDHFTKEKIDKARKYPKKVSNNFFFAESKEPEKQEYSLRKDYKKCYKDSEKTKTLPGNTDYPKIIYDFKGHSLNINKNSDYFSQHDKDKLSITKQNNTTNEGYLGSMQQSNPQQINNPRQEELDAHKTISHNRRDSKSRNAPNRCRSIQPNKKLLIQKKPDEEEKNSNTILPNKMGTKCFSTEKIQQGLKRKETLTNLIADQTKTELEDTKNQEKPNSINLPAINYQDQVPKSTESNVKSHSIRLKDSVDSRFSTKMVTLANSSSANTLVSNKIGDRDKIPNYQPSLEKKDKINHFQGKIPRNTSESKTIGETNISKIHEPNRKPLKPQTKTNEAKRDLKVQHTNTNSKTSTNKSTIAKPTQKIPKATESSNSSSTKVVKTQSNNTTNTKNNKRSAFKPNQPIWR